MSIAVLPQVASLLAHLPHHIAAQVTRWAVLPWEILILGEMGSGKTLLAEYIHQLSGRGGSCEYCSLAQLPNELAIAELSGHVKGAFTGAVKDRAGPFEVAHPGTVLLDEVGDAPAGAQGVLLRVLDRKEI